jgi:hypothetical protein
MVTLRGCKAGSKGIWLLYVHLIQFLLYPLSCVLFPSDRMRAYYGVLNLYSLISLRLHGRLKLWYAYFPRPFILDVTVMHILIRSTPDIIRRFPFHHSQFYQAAHHCYLSYRALQFEKQILPHLIDS